MPDVVGVASPFSPGNGFQIASDRFIAYLTVTFTTASYRLPNAAGEAVIHTAQAVARPGLVVARSRPSWGRTPGWPRASRWALTMVIMLVAFGSVVAMGLPIVIALVGLAVGVAIEELTTHFLVVPVFSPELAVMMGVGVGIDDALLIVPRYRQHLGEGSDPEQATVLALQQAGRAVPVAGATVVIWLLSLFLIGQPYVIGIATGAIVLVVLVLAGSLTLLRALLGFAGPNIDRLSIWRGSRSAQAPLSRGRGFAGAGRSSVIRGGPRSGRPWSW